MSRINIGYLVVVSKFKHIKATERDPFTKEWIVPPPRLLSRKLAYVTGGSYYGSSGGISNFWYWTYFKADGSLSTSHKGNGYNNGSPFSLDQCTNYHLVITVAPNLQESE